MQFYNDALDATIDLSKRKEKTKSLDFPTPKLKKPQVKWLIKIQEKVNRKNGKTLQVVCVEW